MRPTTSTQANGTLTGGPASDFNTAADVEAIESSDPPFPIPLQDLFDHPAEVVQSIGPGRRLLVGDDGPVAVLAAPSPSDMATWRRFKAQAAVVALSPRPGI